MQPMNGAALRRARIPDGATDVLLDDARRRIGIESVLRERFARWGYTEAITPAFEYREAAAASGMEAGRLYAFPDPNGDLLVLRADATAAVARVAATRLREAPRPLRISYVTTVFRRPGEDRRRQAELPQAGVELIGSADPAADAEVLALSIEALQRLGVDDFQLHVGHVGLFGGLFEELDLSQTQIDNLKETIDRRDHPTLERLMDDIGLPEDAACAVLALLALSGGEDALDRAGALVRNGTSQRGVENLAEILGALADFGLHDRVVIDPGEIRGLGYYTGMRCEALSHSTGFAIASGGRYDRLLGWFGTPTPAVGCAFRVDRIASILPRGYVGGPSRTEALIRWDPSCRAAAFARVQEMRQAGRSVELEVVARSETEAIDYARSQGIRRLLAIEPTGPREIPLSKRNARDNEGCVQ